MRRLEARRQLHRRGRIEPDEAAQLRQGQLRPVAGFDHLHFLSGSLGLRAEDVVGRNQAGIEPCAKVLDVRVEPLERLLHDVDGLGGGHGVPVRTRHLQAEFPLDRREIFRHRPRLRARGARQRFGAAAGIERPAHVEARPVVVGNVRVDHAQRPSRLRDPELVDVVRS
jgi:hypothetical protein